MREDVVERRLRVELDASLRGPAAAVSQYLLREIVRGEQSRGRRRTSPRCVRTCRRERRQPDSGEGRRRLERDAPSVGESDDIAAHALPEDLGDRQTVTLLRMQQKEESWVSAAHQRWRHHCSAPPTAARSWPSFSSTRTVPAAGLQARQPSRAAESDHRESKWGSGGG